MKSELAVVSCGILRERRNGGKELCAEVGSEGVGGKCLQGGRRSSEAVVTHWYCRDSGKVEWGLQGRRR